MYVLTYEATRPILHKVVLTYRGDRARCSRAFIILHRNLSGLPSTAAVAVVFFSAAAQESSGIEPL